MPAAFRSEIIVFLRGHPGPVCPECIATSLSLPLREVTMTTFGLESREGFLMESDISCSRCGNPRRVIRALFGVT